MSQPRIDDRCLSDLALDRMIAAREDTHPHLKTCERCRSRLEGFAIAQRQSAVRVAKMIARAAPEEKVRQSWWRSPVFKAAFALCAALLIWVVIPRSEAPAPGVRAKGNGLRFVVQRQGRIEPGISGARFWPGDALRFLVTASTPSYLFLVGVEARSGKVSAYHPFNGTQSARIVQGAERALEGSLVLDSSPEDEFFLAVFSDSPLSLTKIQAAIEATKTSQGYTLSALQALELPGEHHWIVVKKE